MPDPRERHRWHDGHNFRVLFDGTFQGKSPGDPEDKWQTMEGWQSPTMGREIGRLTEENRRLSLNQEAILSDLETLAREFRRG